MKALLSIFSIILFSTQSFAGGFEKSVLWSSSNPLERAVDDMQLLRSLFDYNDPLRVNTAISLAVDHLIHTA